MVPTLRSPGSGSLFLGSGSAMVRAPSFATSFRTASRGRGFGSSVFPEDVVEALVDEGEHGRDGAEVGGEGQDFPTARFDEALHLLVDRDVGAAEAVDALLGVADDEELAGLRGGRRASPWPWARLLVLGQEEGDLGLQGVGVLELVDQDVVEALLEVAADREVSGQDVAGLQEEVGVVDDGAFVACGLRRRRGSRVGGRGGPRRGRRSRPSRTLAWASFRAFSSAFASLQASLGLQLPCWPLWASTYSSRQQALEGEAVGAVGALEEGFEALDLLVGVVVGVGAAWLQGLSAWRRPRGLGRWSDVGGEGRPRLRAARGCRARGHCDGGLAAGRRSSGRG